MHLRCCPRIAVARFCCSFRQRRNIFIDSHRFHRIPYHFHTRIQCKRCTQLIVSIQIHCSHPHSIALDSLHHFIKISRHPTHFYALLSQRQSRVMVLAARFRCVRNVLPILGRVIPTTINGLAIVELRHPVISGNDIRHRLLQVYHMFNLARLRENLGKQIRLCIPSTFLPLRIIVNQHRIATIHLSHIFRQQSKRIPIRIILTAAAQIAKLTPRSRKQQPHLRALHLQTHIPNHRITGRLTAHSSARLHGKLTQRGIFGFEIQNTTQCIRSVQCRTRAKIHLHPIQYKRIDGDDIL